RIAALSVESALARRSHAPGAGPDSVALQLRRAEARLGLGVGDEEGLIESYGPTQARSAPGPAARALPPDMHPYDTPTTRPDGILLRRARLDDIPWIAGIMAGYVAQGVLLPRPVSELYQCVREFHVAERPGVNGAPAEIVACAALRLLWSDLGEVRSLAVREDMHGK